MVTLLEPPPVIYDKFTPQGRAVILESDTSAACASLPPGTFSLIITSPPYNIGKSYEQKTGLEQYLEWQASIIQQLVPLLKLNGSLCWQVGNYINNGEVYPLDVYFYPIFKKLGLQLRNRIIWHFNHGLHASRRFSGRYETLLWFTKTDDYVFNLDNVRVPAKYPGKLHYKGGKRGLPSGNPLGKNPSDFWDLISKEWNEGILEIPNVKSNHPEKTLHPCQFPVELVERCVLALTHEDDWVLDPFAGVGSTLLAAIKTNRRAVAVDRDPGYCATARQRINDYYEGKLRLRPIGKAIHAPSGNEKVAQIPMQWLSNKEKA
ncbi:MAG: site-specific DNA-methyltransferase [Gammaproteobacteria bacterium]|nr:site-specific DNA-methyltransferase [Gammaproteobacteria bacterium]